MSSSFQYFAKGGGCFLAGTLIGTPDGDVAIETLKGGDTVISFNETTKELEDAVIGGIDVLERDHYYIINGIIKVTGEHPFYTKKGIKEVKELHIGDVLVGRYDTDIKIETIKVLDEEVTVYNLLNVTPNHNYFAGNFLVHNKGGGCFLKDTEISIVNGRKKVQDIRAGDRIISFNERTRKNEVSQVQSLDILQADSYFVINGNIKATGEHPFYVADDNGFLSIKLVKELVQDDKLVLEDGMAQLVDTVEEVQETGVTVYNLINVRPNNNYYANGYLVHNKGGVSGGHSSSGGRSSSSSSSKSSSSTSKSSSTPSKPKTGTSTAKPGSTVKTSDGKTVKSSTKTPTKKEYSTSKGVVGDNGYTPKFTNGYNAPAGSVVYYRDTGFVDYLPWIYIFGHSNAAPQNQTATVVQPDGKEVVAKPEPGGTDGLLILNWILLIIIVSAIIAGIIWLINKLTSNDGY